jgi:hypothetical protein
MTTRQASAVAAAEALGLAVRIEENPHAHQAAGVFITATGDDGAGIISFTAWPGLHGRRRHSVCWCGPDGEHEPLTQKQLTAAIEMMGKS